jgi:3',5'-nucleoside bisphosphate phosphatase
MPARQPFTALCRAATRRPTTGRADLHVHTTHSDGTYSPAQVVDLARRSGLTALAITDHDTLAAFAEARALGSSTLEIVPGVEITAEYRGRELHLLAYFVRPEDVPLTTALARLREHRVARFWDMVERLRGHGVALDEETVRAQAGVGVLGRRNLAVLLERAGRVGSVREAFTKYLSDSGRVALPKLRLPVHEAIDLVRGAGGVAAWAHPSYDCNRETLAELSGWGLGAVEAAYPAHRAGRGRELRALAAAAGLAISGGSDCHGPEPVRRAIGVCSVSADELAELRNRAMTQDRMPILSGRAGQDRHPIL